MDQIDTRTYHDFTILINTKNKNVHFYNQTNVNITRSGVINQETINTHDLCYQCSKDVPDFLFGRFSNRYSRDEPHLQQNKIIIKCLCYS